MSAPVESKKPSLWSTVVSIAEEQVCQLRELRGYSRDLSMISTVLLILMSSMGCERPFSGPNEDGGSGSIITAIEVSPEQVTLAEGESLQLNVSSEDIGDDSLRVLTTWSSSNKDVATVDSTGVVTALRGGSSAQIVASAQEVSDTSSIQTTASASFTDDFESGDLSSTSNGISWTNAVRSSVVDTGGAHSGTSYLAIVHPAKPDGDDSHAFADLELGNETGEIWVEYYFYTPGNYEHRSQDGPTNNKFFQLFTRPRSDPALLIAPNTLMSSSAISDLKTYTQRTGGCGQAAGNLMDGFIKETDRGKWRRLRWHVKLGTPGVADGLLEFWVDDTLVLSSSSQDINGCSSEQNYLDALRLLGWSNSGYDAETVFRFDDLKVYLSDPSW